MSSKYSSRDIEKISIMLRDISKSAPVVDPSRKERRRLEIQKSCLTIDELVSECANWSDWATFMEESYYYSNKLSSVQDFLLDLCITKISEYDQKYSLVMDEFKSILASEITDAAVAGRDIDRSKRAKRAADVRHSKPGGAREKTDEIRRIWASGKYTSKDRCAEEECGALNISFSSARKALRNQ